MATDPVTRSLDALTSQLKRRRFRLDRYLLFILVVLIIGGRYGINAVLFFVVLPLVVGAFGKAVSEVMSERSHNGGGAAAQALSDRLPRFLVLLIVGGLIVARIDRTSEDDPPPPDPCYGLATEIDHTCRSTTTSPDTTDTASPSRTGSTLPTSGAAVEPECPPEGNDDRETLFTRIPPVCIDQASNYLATITTNYGEFQLSLNTAEAPVTVNNFVFLARWHYYDGVTLTYPRPHVDATMLYSGEPEEESRSPGYGVTFDLGKPPYPECIYAVMTDGFHPDRFAIVIGDEGRSEIERQAYQYPLLGKLVNGVDVVADDISTGLHPAYTSEEMVIESVTITEQPAPTGSTTQHSAGQPSERRLYGPLRRPQSFPGTPQPAERSERLRTQLSACFACEHGSAPRS